MVVSMPNMQHLCKCPPCLRLHVCVHTQLTGLCVHVRFFVQQLF